MRWIASIKGHKIVVSSEQLDAFRQIYLEKELSSRLSDLIIFDMCILDLKFGIAPQEILASIKSLERGELCGNIKPATQFNKPPLKGLWHKHYFSARFLAQNISLGLGRNGLEKLIREVLDPSEPTITKEMIQELAHRISHEPFEQRVAEKRLTGEWIIFAKHGGVNYYLSLDTHRSGDQNIFDRIMNYCPRNFPDLRAWITATVKDS